MRSFVTLTGLSLLVISSLIGWEGPFPLWTDGNPKTVDCVAGFFLYRNTPRVFFSSAQPVPPEEPRIPPVFLTSTWDGGGWTEPEALPIPLEPYEAGSLLLDAGGRPWFLSRRDTGKAEDPGYLLASHREGDSWSDPELVYEITPGIQVVNGARVVLDARGRIWWIMEHKWLGPQQDDGYELWAFVREDGLWTGPRVIADSEGDDIRPSAAADADGGIWLAWVRRSVSGGHSLMTRYIAGDHLSGEMQVPLPDSSAFLYERGISVTVDERGDPWLGFILLYRDDAVASVSRYSSESGWSMPRILGTHAESDTLDNSVNVEKGEGGEVWCAWTTRPLLWYLPSCGRIMLSRYDGGWSRPEVVVDDFTNRTPVIRVDESNRLWLCWMREGDGGSPGELMSSWYAWKDSPTSIEPSPPGGALPRQISLSQNVPNPFNPLTTMSFILPEGIVQAELTVFDSRGRRVKTIRIHDAYSCRGSVTWDGRDEGGRKVRSGVYFYRLTAGEETVTRKMLLVE